MKSFSGMKSVLVRAGILTGMLLAAVSCAPVGYTTDSNRTSYISDRDADAGGIDRDGFKRSNFQTRSVANHSPRKAPAKAPVTSYRNHGIFKFKEMIQRKAKRYQLDQFFLLALGQAESSGNPMAVSSADCRGLTQLSIRTARDYDAELQASDLHNPETNLEIGSRHLVHLRKLIARDFPEADLERRIVLMAAAWNAGWSRVRRARGVPNISETKIFTQRVLKYYRQYRWGTVS